MLVKAATIDPSYQHLGWYKVDEVEYELVLYEEEYLFVWVFDNQVYHL